MSSVGAVGATGAGGESAAGSDGSSGSGDSLETTSGSLADVVAGSCDTTIGAGVSLTMVVVTAAVTTGGVV